MKTRLRTHLDEETLASIVVEKFTRAGDLWESLYERNGESCAEQRGQEASHDF